jgi:tetratricopeptide (TPR) repeat protein
VSETFMVITQRLHRTIRLGMAALLLASAVTVTDARFIMVEIRKVPVQRLAANIERQLAQNPSNVELRLNLARLYAMAYALKATEFDAHPKGENLEPWFGHTPPLMPGPVREAPSRESQDRAKADLARAVALYADVIQRDPSNAIAHLGHAWVLDQSGDTARAIAEYRRVVELAWPADQKQTSFWNDPATSEAARRLRELLDPVADAKEIAALEQKEAELSKKGRTITPIAISLGSTFDRPPVDRAARVLFDADGSGLHRRWTWITPDAGWLVHDPDATGRITSALQWFGSTSFWLFWENGYHALAALDDDGDGELRGPELKHLAIWRDIDQNGISDPGEVRPLSAHGIVALACRYDEGDGEWTAARAPQGVTYSDGTTRPTYDVILRSAGSPVSITLNRP